MLDNLLDSGLKQYGQVLPRTGLETRVLANLRAKQENRVARPWPWWPTAVTVALCALAAGALFMIRKPGNGPELRIHRSAADTASQGRHTPAATLCPAIETWKDYGIGSDAERWKQMACGSSVSKSGCPHFR